MGHIAHRGTLGAVLMPKEIFRDPRLTGNERLFLCTLFEYTDNETGICTISGTTIEELSTVAARNLKPIWEKLVEKKWLVVESGNTKCTNKYQVTIPLPDETWGYTYATDKKLTSTEWAEKQKAHMRKKKEDMLKKKIRMNTFYCQRPEELIAELADEIELGKQYIPDSVLENFAMVRGGDNSDEARELRRALRAVDAKGVVDPFEECGGAAEARRPAGNFASMTKQQLLDYGFTNGADAIDEAILHKAGLSRNFFPE